MPRIIKRKKDYAESKTDEMLSDLEKRIEKEYRTAYNEVSEKYLNFIEGSAVREEEKLRQLQEGKITEADFKKWKEGQVFIGKRWSDMADELAQDLTKVDKKALSMTNGFLPDAYALNHNYATYEVEKRFGINSSYTLYSRETVERLLRDDPNMLPKRKVDVAKDKRWNKQHINSAITQGVLQGDDLKSISKRLRSVTDMDKTAAIRNARTMMTGAQNSGRIDAMKRMKGIGVNVKKEWIATLDHHTRASHGRLDGEVVDIDKKFSNGCMYPGDPNGLPAEVYNCRCTIGYNFPEYPDEDVPRYDNENQKRIKGMTYTQWAGWKEKNNLKEYDFEGKKALYKPLKEDLDEANRKLQRAEYNSKYETSREEYIKELEKEYKDVSDFTAEDVSKLQKKIEELEKEGKKLEADHDKWYKRPSDPEEKEAWREWKRKWEEEHGESAPDAFYRIQEEKYKYIEQVNNFKRFQKKMDDSLNYETKKELLESLENAKKEYEKKKAVFDSNFTEMDFVLMDAHDKNISYKRVNRLKKALDGDEIIKRLAGGDMTKGSCHSLALCYAGNKAGMDVIDFRGGDSQDFFANYRIDDMLLEAGMKGRTETAINEQKSALKLLHSMETNKEYILSGGRHAAVVRKNEEGYYEYLEMQSKWQNGWKELGKDDDDIADMLKWRFSMQQSRSFQGKKYERTVYLLDVDSAKDVENYDVMLGFMNTDANEQMKGKSGDIK